MRRFFVLVALVGCGAPAAKPAPSPLVVPPLSPPPVEADGAACDLEDDFVCSPDKLGMLRCMSARWKMVQTCLGARGCSLAAKKVTCDNSRANESDACREEDDYACTLDTKTALVCRSGRFVPASRCEGPNGCAIVGSNEEGFRVRCDDSIATAGDLCEKQDHYSCSGDGHSILRCASKKLVVDGTCKPTEACAIRGGAVGCYP